MRFGRRVLAVTLACAFLGTGQAAAEILYFSATLDGAQANNCAGTGSPGTGTGTFVLDTVTMEVDYSISFSGLQGPETVSHVHQEAALCDGGPPAYNLPLGSPKVGTATLTAAQVTAMQNGLHYVNVHSSVFPGGEIRGQIVGVERVPVSSDLVLALLVLGFGVAGIFLLRRRNGFVQS